MTTDNTRTTKPEARELAEKVSAVAVRTVVRDGSASDAVVAVLALLAPVLDAKDQRIAELADERDKLIDGWHEAAKLQERLAEAERERDDQRAIAVAAIAARERNAAQVRALSARVEEAKAIMRDLDLDTEKDAMRAGIGFGVWKRLRAFLASPAEPQDFAAKLAAAQKPLDPQAAEVLNRNLWELYDASPAVLAVAGSGEVEKPTCCPKCRTGERCACMCQPPTLAQRAREVARFVSGGVVHDFSNCTEHAEGDCILCEDYDVITAALRDLVMEAARAVCGYCKRGQEPKPFPNPDPRYAWCHVNAAEVCVHTYCSPIFAAFHDAHPTEPPQAPAVAGEEE